MQLQDINKQVYRKHLNIVIGGFIVTFLSLSLAFGSILIASFSEVGYSTAAPIDSQTEQLDSVGTSQTEKENSPAATEIEPVSNFKYNLLGVILALLACAAILHSIKNSKFFCEIYYVWQLKQVQNLIFRKLKKIKKAAQEGEEHALTILCFYYKSLKQVYLLDDNIITMNTIERELNQIEEIIANNNLNITAERFDKTLLASYA